MWLDQEDNEDPYNRSNSAPTPSSSDTLNVGSGAGSSAPSSSDSDGGSKTTSTPSTLNPTAPTPQPKQASIQDYLGANQSQGNQLGQQFQTGLSNAATSDTGAIDTAADNVTKQAQDATVNYDPNLVSKAAADPTSVANDPNSLNSFLNQWNASYTGPANFEGTDDYTTANAAATDAQQKGTETADTGGRQQLLADNFGDYGQGNKNLDQGLLQNSDNFGQVLQTGQQLSSIPDYLASKAADVDIAATNAADTTAATQQQTQAALANSASDLQTGINNEVTAAQTAVQSNIAPLEADLSSGDASKLSGDLDKLNVPAAQKASIIDYLTSLNKDFGTNPNLSNDYTFNPATQITAANTATAADYAKAAAIQKLTGQDTSGILNQANAAQAGTDDQSATGLNSSAIDQTLRQDEVEQELEKLNPSSVASPGGSSQPGSNQSVGDYLKQKVGPIAGVVSPLITGTTAAIGGAINGISKSISSAFGGGHKDATVNLPTLNMPATATPTIADSAGTKQIVDLLNKPITTSGSYHEGAVYDVVSRLGQLQSLYNQGQLTKSEYNSYAVPLAQWANSAVQTISSASSQAANAVKGAYQQLQAGGYLNPIQ